MPGSTHESSLRKQGPILPCSIDQLRLHSQSKPQGRLRPSSTGYGVNALVLGPGSVSAFTRVFDALWAGTTEEAGLSFHARMNAA
jgi:hypothetical protein